MPVKKVEFPKYVDTDLFSDNAHYNRWKEKRRMEDMKFLFIEQQYRVRDINEKINDALAENNNQAAVPLEKVSS